MHSFSNVWKRMLWQTNTNFTYYGWKYCLLLHWTLSQAQTLSLSLFCTMHVYIHTHRTSDVLHPLLLTCIITSMPKNYQNRVSWMPSYSSSCCLPILQIEVFGPSSPNCHCLFSLWWFEASCSFTWSISLLGGCKK